MAQTIPSREEINAADTWDASSIFASDADWQAAIDTLGNKLTEAESYRGQLGSGPEKLTAWLDLYQEIVNLRDRIYVYASMFYAVNTADQSAAAKRDRAIATYTRAIGALAFAEPEILAIDRATIESWLRDDSRLAIYAHHFDRLWQLQEHVRSAEVEQLLGQVLDPFFSATSVHGTMVDADLRFEPARNASGDTFEVGQGTINALLRDEDREVRRTAFESYADAHLAMRNSLANCLLTGVKQDVFMARARRFTSSLEAAMAQNFIPETVFRNLIDTYRRHLPTWHRYWNVRRRALGYDKLHVYDIKAPLTPETMHVSFDQAVEWIALGMRPLGDEYVSVLRDGVLEQRWVDRYPNKGKRMGAFSSGTKGTHPFILMSFTDDIFSMSTLAHELGHSMHSYLTWQNQPEVYADYSLFVAEVASNFNQAMVRAYLLDELKDPNDQIAVIEEAMSNFHRYFFIMPTLARFELEIHERVERGEPLTADSLNTLMTDLFREGYGHEVVIDEDRIGSTWMQFSTHLYANFYVYQYATGISAAHALAERVQSGDQTAVENYLKFLRTGSALYPLDALKVAGVDMNSPEAVEQTFGVLARFVDRLEELTQARTA